MDGAVEHHDGRQPARTEATGRLEGQPTVVRRGARGDVEGPADGLHDAVCALHEAGGAGADGAGVVAGGFEGEELIEGGDAVDHRRRKAERTGHVDEHVLGEVAEHVLGDVQGLDELVLGVAHPLEVLVDQGEAIVTGRMGLGPGRSGGVAHRRHLSVPFGSRCHARCRLPDAAGRAQRPGVGDGGLSGRE